MTSVSPDFPGIEDLAHFGDGSLAYIKPISVEDAQQLIGDMGVVPPNLELYCLFGADGTPLAISDSQALALENALEHDLEAIRLH